MGRYKAMAKTVNHFKVKGTRKKLEKAARRSKKRKLGGEEIMEGAKDIIMEKDGQMEIDCEGQKAKGITKRNENRLRKHELPFMDSAGKGNKLKNVSKARDRQPGKSSDVEVITSNRQFTKKKARKMLRNWSREKRKKDREVNAMV